MSQIVLSLLVTVVSSYGLSAQSKKPSDYYFEINKTARTYSTDSILTYLNGIHSPKGNNYVVKDSRHLDLLRILHKFNEVLIFNEEGQMFKLHGENRCVNNSLMLGNLQLGVIDPSQNLDSFLALIQPITPSSIIPHRITALIFWNFSTGVSMDDIPFDWETILTRKFGNNINIAKVNTDVNESWRGDIKISALLRLQKILQWQSESLR